MRRVTDDESVELSIEQAVDVRRRMNLDHRKRKRVA
jgi:hypothetical protein